MTPEQQAELDRLAAMTGEQILDYILMQNANLRAENATLTLLAENHEHRLAEVERQVKALGGTHVKGKFDA